MSEKELLLIIRDLLGFAIHGNIQAFYIQLKDDLNKVEEAISHLRVEAHRARLTNNDG